MNFNRLIDLGRGDGFGSIGENFSRKLRGVCLNRKVFGFQRVEFFFRRDAWTCLVRRVYGVKLSDSNEFRDKVVSFVRCSLSTWNLKTCFASREISRRGKGEEKRGKKGRGIFVIRKRKVRLSRWLQCPGIFDLTLFPSLILTLPPSPTFRPKIFHH